VGSRPRFNQQAGERELFFQRIVAGLECRIALVGEGVTRASAEGSCDVADARGGGRERAALVGERSYPRECGGSYDRVNGVGYPGEVR
jgi:hypothetical protein